MKSKAGRVVARQQQGSEPSKAPPYPKDTIRTRRLKLLSSIILIERVCYNQLKAIRGKLGLRVKQLSAVGLRDRLKFLYTYRLELGDLKAINDTV